MEPVQHHYSYEELHYVGKSYFQTHPHQMAVLGRLYGMNPAPVEQCRVLEIACGDGANLVPMAYALPESTFLGVDLAAGPLKVGRDWIAALGLANLRLEACDLTQFPTDAGQFDYIIAHGIYSWCPPEVREQLLAVCTAHLAPQGLAFVSFNAYPGYHTNEQHRHMMLYHLAQIGPRPPGEQIQEALGMLSFVANAQPAENLYQLTLNKGRQDFEHHIARQGPIAGPAWFHHDLLSDHNHPVYFHEFAQHADRCGLQFVSDATLRLPRMTTLPPEALATLESLRHNPVVQEQYFDFIQGMPFRQVILTHRAARIDRRVGPETMRGLYVAGEFAPENEAAVGGGTTAPDATVTYRAPKGKVAVNHPAAKAILQRLGEAWPAAVPCAELLGGNEGQAGSAGEAADFLLRMVTQKLAALRLRASEGTTALSERPEASAMARLQAETGTRVTTLHHVTISLNPALRRLVRLLDGQRDRAGLLAEMRAWIESGQAAEDYRVARAEASAETDEEDLRMPELATLEHDVDTSLRALTNFGLIVR